MLEQYFPIAVFLIVGFGLGVVLMTAGSLLGPSRPGLEKNSPYECGFEAFDDARMRFDVRYYLLAILFIVFDLEVAFLVPWAVVLDELVQRVQVHVGEKLRRQIADGQPVVAARIGQALVLWHLRQRGGIAAQLVVQTRIVE